MQNEELGRVFHKKRQNLAYNLQVVSWRTGLSESTISKAERGTMTERTKAALLAFYGDASQPKHVSDKKDRKS